MTKPVRTLTLPDLQTQLDRLDPGEQVTIGGPTCQRLFGHDDLSRQRLDRFAAGHHCKAEQYDHAVTFRKWL